VVRTTTGALTLPDVAVEIEEAPLVAPTGTARPGEGRP
jgi:hypothetical protein